MHLRLPAFEKKSTKREGKLRSHRAQSEPEFQADSILPKQPCKKTEKRQDAGLQSEAISARENTERFQITCDDEFRTGPEGQPTAVLSTSGPISRDRHTPSYQSAHNYFETEARDDRAVVVTTLDRTRTRREAGEFGYIISDSNSILASTSTLYQSLTMNSKTKDGFAMPSFPLEAREVWFSRFLGACIGEKSSNEPVVVTKRPVKVQGAAEGDGNSPHERFVTMIMPSYTPRKKGLFHDSTTTMNMLQPLHLSIAAPPESCDTARSEETERFEVQIEFRDEHEESRCQAVVVEMAGEDRVVIPLIKETESHTASNANPHTQKRALSKARSSNMDSKSTPDTEPTNSDDRTPSSSSSDNDSFTLSESESSSSEGGETFGDSTIETVRDHGIGSTPVNKSSRTNSRVSIYFQDQKQSGLHQDAHECIEVVLVELQVLKGESIADGTTEIPTGGRVSSFVPIPRFTERVPSFVSHRSAPDRVDETRLLANLSHGSSFIDFLRHTTAETTTVVFENLGSIDMHWFDSQEAEQQQLNTHQQNIRASPTNASTDASGAFEELPMQLNKLISCLSPPSFARDEYDVTVSSLFDGSNSAFSHSLLNKPPVHRI